MDQCIIAGVMSGSSLDGLDLAIVRFTSDDNWELLYTSAIPYPDIWVDRLQKYNQLDVIDFTIMQSEYSHMVAQLLKPAILEYRRPIDYISFHGHTLIHLPDRKTTLQIGNGAVLAADCGISTIVDFRSADIAHGGVGTPLAPLVETVCFPGFDYYLNLGGIANLTMIKENSIVAYDVCPCNQVLNHFSQKLGEVYDDQGMMARSGHYIQDIVSYMDALPYNQFQAPKSLDNNWIVNMLLPMIDIAEPKDVLHSYCAWMASIIASQIVDNATISRMLVTGGGAHNSYFIEVLNKELASKSCKIEVPEKEVVDYKEALLMALLGYYYTIGRPNVFAQVTGAKKDSIGGALYKV